MFKLDQAIAEWRRQMLDAGIRTPVPLDELESHLHEEVERQMRARVGAEQAFRDAVQRMGQAQALKTEFAKAGKAPAALGKLMGSACVFLVGFILLLSGFTFFQMRMGLGEQIVAYLAVAITMVVACGWRYAVPFLPVFPNRRKRMVVGWACILFGFGCSFFLSNIILPRFEHDQNGQIPALGFWLVFPIAVCSCLGLALMMSARAREYWGMNKVSRKRTAAAR